MKKASMILAIVGGVLAILAALSVFRLSYMVATNLPEMMETVNTDDTPDYEVSFMNQRFEIMSDSLKRKAITLLVVGALGILGAAMLNKNKFAATVMMFAAAIGALFTFYGFVSFILLLIAGIFAIRAPYTGPDIYDMPNAGYDRL